MKDTLHVQTITLENIPLLAAITSRTEVELRDAFYKAKAKGTTAFMLIDDYRTFLHNWQSVR